MSYSNMDVIDMKIPKYIPSLTLLLALPLAAAAADRYVSASGLYDGQPAFTDLQAAVNAAAASDTIWVEDGFSCSTGQTVNATYGNSRILISKAVTVRSRSGTMANPAIIRGAWHDPEAEIALGTNAVRCVRSTSSGTKLIGFRLEGGATVVDTNWRTTIGAGGGFLGYGTVSNCLITGNTAYAGGGASGLGWPSFYNCVISNNLATLNAGGVQWANCFDTQILDNRADTSGGGGRDFNATDCLIAGNVAGQSGGGCGGYTDRNPYLIDCVITNNEAGGDGGGVQYWPTLTRCLVGWNRAGGAGGGACGAFAHLPVKAYDSLFIGNTAGGRGGGAGNILAVDCIFTNNFSRGNGGGAANGTLSDCILVGNVASNTVWGTGCGGGFATGTISNSLVASNRAYGRNADGTLNAGIGTGGGVYGDSKDTKVVDCVISNNVADSRGGGVHLTTGYNNLIIDNRGGSNGGGGCGGSHYNSLIVGNTTTGTGGGAGYEAYLYNCTILDNTAPTRGGVQYCYLVNTITWDNTGTADQVVWATNSCGLVLTEAMGPGNTTRTPRLIAAGEEQFLPGPGSPAINSGLAFSWMTDPADFRSHDRNGNRRLRGSGVDMGAFEVPMVGSMMILR